MSSSAEINGNRLLTYDEVIARRPAGAACSLFAVVCTWADRRGQIVTNEGSLAIIVEAVEANEAQDLAYAAHPELWADDGLTRQTAVYPATAPQQDKGSVR